MSDHKKESLEKDTYRKKVIKELPKLYYKTPSVRGN